MPRHISFSETINQVRDRDKTVTRRMGWWDLEAGEELIGVEKAQGLKKGERVVPICRIRVISARTEELHDIRPEDPAREGFPLLNREQFIAMFCRRFKCQPDDLVRRIEFEYIE